MNFRPLFDKLLIKRDDAEEKSPGGLYIPKTSEEIPARGVIVAAGEGARTEEGKAIPMTVKIGDKVIFGKYAGSDVEIDGVKYVIIEEENVMGIIE